MSQTLKIDNFGATNIIQPGVLDADSTAGATSIILQNTAGFLTTAPIVIGQLTAQTSEPATVSAVPNATSLTVSALTLVHKRFETVTQLFGNSVNIYRASNVDGTLPADASFTLLTNVTLDYNSATTSYTDAIGSSAYWYKFTYYNSTSSTETSLADSIAQRGGGYGHYCSVADVRTEAGFENNANISDAVVDSRRIDGEQEINGELYEVYTLPFTAPIPHQIQQVNRLLAAGWLLLKEYGVMTSGGSHDGEAKLNEARGILSKIKSREITLTDPSGASLMIQEVVSSWPNKTTDQTGSGIGSIQAAAQNEDFGPKFRSAQRF